MGYSNLQFGYWSREPVDPNDKTSLPSVSSQISFPEGAAMAANNCMQCDVAIVGSGFAGALIANELSAKGIKVIILEAGPGVQPNINDFMKRFYTASAKVPESAYPPELFVDPGKLAAGRPTSLMLDAANWQDPKQSYLIQKGPRPFTSTYERVAGGTAHWLGTSLRLVPNDFRMKTTYGKNQSNFPLPDWPAAISSENMSPYYARAEAELGVSADVDEQRFLGIDFPKDYAYPMPRIPPSLLDQRIGDALAKLTEDETKFLEMDKPVTEIKVRSLPAARNSQPYRNRRACAGNTNCIPICPIQAKYDPTITLNEATDKGAILIDHAVASEIVVEADASARSTLSGTRTRPDRRLEKAASRRGPTSSPPTPSRRHGCC